MTEGASPGGDRDVRRHLAAHGFRKMERRTSADSGAVWFANTRAPR